MQNNPNTGLGARTFTTAELAARRSSRTIYSETELISYIGQCAALSSVCAVTLGADIFYSAPIILPSTLKSFSLFGNNFSLKKASNYVGNTVFDVRFGTSSVYAPMILDNLRIDGDGVNAVIMGASTIYTPSTISGCYIDGFINVFDIGHVQNSYIADSVITATVATEIFSEAVTLTDSLIQNISGNYAISIAVDDSTGNTFARLSPNYVFCSYSVTNYKRNTWVGIYSDSLTWTAYDIVVGGTQSNPAALSVGTTTIAVTADNQSVSTTARSFICLASDSALGFNRTITLTNGVDGQMLTLLCTSNTLELADSGNCNLSALWSPGVGDTIQLIFSGSTWYELSRSNN